ncbi:PDZ domain-containing protein [Paenibacillus pasadenensis]|uniref:PDZ domain-containing protein n=1 Tax=Paenibacillus pasadenensis TaxID=217090 RepID=UPI002042544B|nr:PDZ domain-containing protein [Paenibacillus pasadenensis]MCM3745809.1 PDZ domain-containing protein [Paenibacillus pasadenensis]
MSKGIRWYIASFAAAILASVAGQLIWLADPLRAGSFYWMDMIEWLARGCALIPLCWTIGAYRSWSGSKSRRLPVLKLLIAAGGMLTAALLVLQPDRYSALAAAGGVTALLVLLDTAAEERRRRRFPLRTAAFAVVLLALGALLFYPTSYAVTMPGFTLNMNRYAQVEGGGTHGSLEGVLVIERPAFPVDWLYASLLPHMTLSKRDTSIPISEIQRQVSIQRAGANEVGTAVALQKLGLGKGVMPLGIQVLAVLKNSPSKGMLEPGDVLLSINGQTVRDTDELAEVMSGVQPGSEVKVGYERGSLKNTAVVTAGQSADDAKRAVLGVQVQDRTKADLTRAMSYRPYLVYQGGPSHGAMLALTVLDQLTPDGVTYGNQVAGTGTIDNKGNVGPIGGIEQKAFTVERAGADVFFVPAGQEQDARKGAKKLNIVPVRTLDEMLAWLKENPKQR